MNRPRWPILLLVAAFIANACQVIPDDLSQQIAPRTEYKTTEAAFHVLLERHVDRPTSQSLATGAIEGAELYLQTSLGQDGGGCESLTIERPELTGSSESDLVKLSQAFDTALEECPTGVKELLERHATDFMARSLNECHTYYLDSERAASFNQPPQEYSGIGATVTSTTPNELVEISSVFPGSPAQFAGVAPGDRIQAVNGEDVSGLTAEEVASRIRGSEGTPVVLTLLRGTREITIEIIRARLTPPRVLERTWDEGAIAHLTVFALNGDVARQAADAVQRYSEAGVKAFILDLRNDPGGDLSAAVDLASIFVKDAVLVYQVGRDGDRRELRTNDRFFEGTFDKPLVVMVNERSASGAEIIAAGLAANGAATVIGNQTAGCVGIGQPREMPDGGLLLVTIARMQDLEGKDLNGEGAGVVPDLIVLNDPDTPEEEEVEAALEVLRQKVAAQP